MRRGQLENWAEEGDEGAYVGSVSQDNLEPVLRGDLGDAGTCKTDGLGHAA